MIINTGITQGQYGDHYPLVDPSEDIQYLIADMSVCYDNPQFEYELPIFITRIGGTDASTASLKLETLSGNVLIDVNAPVYTAPWSHSWIIYYWESDYTQVKAILRQELQTILKPENAILDIRAVYLKPPHVRSINGESATSIICKAGNNIALDLTYTSKNTVYAPTTLHIDAIAGEGAGKITPDCDEKPEVIKSINGIQPSTQGTFHITTSGGYGLQATCSGLKLINTNTPCCTCEDMNAFLRYLVTVNDLNRDTQAKVHYVANLYQDVITRWAEAPICSRAFPGMAFASATEYPYVDMSLELANITEYCWIMENAGFVLNRNVEIVHGIRTWYDNVTNTVPVLKNGSYYMRPQSTYVERRDEQVRLESREGLQDSSACEVTASFGYIPPGGKIALQVRVKVEKPTPGMYVHVSCHPSFRILSDTDTSITDSLLTGTAFEFNLHLPDADSLQDTIDDKNWVQQIKEAIWTLKATEYSSCSEE